jgi:hypothetical protein
MTTTYTDCIIRVCDRETVEKIGNYLTWDATSEDFRSGRPVTCALGDTIDIDSHYFLLQEKYNLPEGMAHIFSSFTYAEVEGGDWFICTVKDGILYYAKI